MECKDNSQDLRSGPLAVLIETLWNVKFIDLCIEIGSYLVLIETLWNVKIIERKTEQDGGRY